MSGQTAVARSSPARRRRALAAGTLLALGLLAAVLVLSHLSGRRAREATINTHDVTAWAPPGTLPLTDAQAAALVTDVPETRPANAPANDDVPTDAQLATFHAAKNADGQTPDQFNPLNAYVTGRPGLKDPSTDDLIQWVSHKWGIPTDWIRAEMVVESRWRQSQRGDEATVSPQWYAEYPAVARVPGGDEVYESLGIAQEKWRPDGSVGSGTEPLRWESTAFSLDFYAATLRYYYDGDCHWCTRGYSAGQAWNSVGAWFSPNTWDNSGAQQYVAAVQSALGDRVWEQSGF